MANDYPKEDPKPTMASEPITDYEVTVERRVISEEEMACCFELKEFKQHMDDLVESTHNHATGCVEITPVVPRRCSIEDAKRRSMTIDQFTANLYAMVDDYYRAKA